MQTLRALGLILLAAVVTAVAQELHRRMPGLPIPFADSLLGAAIVAGVACVAAYAAARLRLPVPVLLAVVGYCLGAGIETALSAYAALPSDSPAHLVQIALVNAASAGVMMPLQGGGFEPNWGNLVSLVIAALGAQMGAERGRQIAPKTANAPEGTDPIDR